MERYERGDVSARLVAGMERPQRHAPRRVPGTTLVKALVSFQFASRRISLAAIEHGRVLVNDEVNTEPNTHVKLDKDIIAVDGMVLQRKSVKPMTAVFHKPHGLNGSREEYRLSLYSSLSNKRNWYVPSGALVKTASGIVIVSNDRKHANYQTSVIRAFTQDLFVKVHRRVTEEEISSLKELLRKQWPDDDKILQVERGRDNTRSSWIKVTCRSGNFHGIAVALKSLGLEVLNEERRRLGPFSTDNLQPGAWYKLSDQEVIALEELAAGARPETTPLKEVWDDIALRLFEQQKQSS